MFFFFLLTGYFLKFYRYSELYYRLSREPCIQKAFISFFSNTILAASQTPILANFTNFRNMKVAKFDKGLKDMRNLDYNDEEFYYTQVRITIKGARKFYSSSQL